MWHGKGKEYKQGIYSRSHKHSVEGLTGQHMGVRGGFPHPSTYPNNGLTVTCSV